MPYRNWNWKCRDNTRMYACEWVPEHADEIRAVIGLVHGMGEHMGRYSHVAEMFNKEGYSVLGFDQRGHGQTEGKRGHTPSYDALLEGIDKLCEEACSKYPGVPLFLYGHSLGGNLTLNYILRRKPQLVGAVVSGPWLKLAFKPPALQAFIGRAVEMIYPQYTNSRPIQAEALTSDPAMIQRYVNDKRGHGLITAKFFLGVQRAGIWAIKHASELTTPILLMHGDDDRVTSLPASKEFAEGAGSSVTWIEWPGFKHELHNEIGREDVFLTVRSWIRKQLAAHEKNS